MCGKQGEHGARCRQCFGVELCVCVIVLSVGNICVVLCVGVGDHLHTHTSLKVRIMLDISGGIGVILMYDGVQWFHQ